MVVRPKTHTIPSDSTVLASSPPWTHQRNKHDTSRQTNQLGTSHPRLSSHRQTSWEPLTRGSAHTDKPAGNLSPEAQLTQTNQLGTSHPRLSSHRQTLQDTIHFRNVLKGAITKCLGGRADIFYQRNTKCSFSLSPSNQN